MLTLSLIFLLAVLYDLVLGEPPKPLHPVVWLGKVIAFLESRTPRHGDTARFFYGLGAVLIGVALFIIPAYLFLALLKGFNTWLFVAVSAWLLKSTFSLRELARSAAKIKGLLQGDRIDEARHEMRSLVSRDVSRLEEPLLVAATVESVAENTSDSLVAPILYFFVLGVPGALLYRVVNTYDSMIGYHGKYEHLGKFAARLDDVLNFVPARITGVLIVAAACITGKNGKAAWRLMWRDHGKTESPNAGWPMSAAAGALEVQLEKVGHYVLGDARMPLTLDKIDGSLSLMRITAGLAVLLGVAIGGLGFVYFS